MEIKYSSEDVSTFRETFEKNAEEKRMSVKVTIDGHRYEVGDFIPHHPGEKEAKGRTLRKYADQDITDVFFRYHAKPKRRERSQLILNLARQLGEYNGVKYLGPA